ncbi:MAG: hypothetical protein LBJ46_00815 [Planctomycetota bacterium]|jgi:IS5 family transposase|nr:hypothetical protein [Planctomycetota bacterium]
MMYSIHAPKVECISKGKAHRKYEFGNKASYSTTSREGFVIGALSVHGNPCDGHTLSGAIEQAKHLCGGRKPGRVFVDQGYKGHGYAGDTGIHICDRRKLPSGLRRRARRRSAIGPIIGHTKNDGRLGRNYLRCIEGDRTNAMLCAVGQNLSRNLRFISCILCTMAHVGGIFYI